MERDEIHESVLSRRPPLDKGDIFYLLGLVLLIFTIFFVYIWEGTSPLSFDMDLDTQFYLYSFFTAASYSSGHFPLWTPHIYCGMPFLAFIHTSTLYPFRLIFQILEFGPAHLISSMFHLYVYGAFFYLFFRQLGWRGELSFLMAALMCLTGYYIRMHNFHPSIFALAWAPAILWSLARLGERVSLARFAAFAGFTSLAVLGGDIEGLSHLFIISAAGIVIGAWRFRSRINGLVVWAMAMAAVFLLIGAQLIPLAEFSSRDLRKIGLTYKYFTEGYNLRTLAAIFLNLVAPYNRWLLSFELGGLRNFEPLPFIPFIVVMLGIAGMTRLKRDGDAKYWLALLLYTCMVLAIATPPIGWLFYHTPFLNRFIRPYRSLYLFQLAWVLLAGCGARYFHDRGGRKLFIALVIGAAAQAVIQQIVYPRPELYAIILSPLLLLAGRRFLDNRRFKFAVIGGILCLDALFPTPWRGLPRYREDILKPRESYARIFGQMTGLARTVNVGVRLTFGPPPIPEQAGILGGAQTFEGWLTLPLYRAIRLLSLLDARAIIIKNNKLDKSRTIYIFKDGKFIKPENMALINLLNLRYYACMGCNLKVSSPYTLDISEKGRPVYIETGSYLEFMADALPVATRPSGPATAELTIDFEEQGAQGRKWRLWTESQSAPGQVKHIVNLSKIYGKTGDLLFSTASHGPLHAEWTQAEIHNTEKPFQRIFKGDWELYRNKEAFPRAFIVHHSVVAEDMEQALAVIEESRGNDLSSAVVLEREFAQSRGLPPAQAPPTRQNSWESVEISEYRPESMKIGASLATPGFLFISDTYYPGWRAYEGDRELPIQPADVNFRAIALNPGVHNIEMVYRPAGFKIGLWMTIASLIAICLMTAVSRGCLLTGARPHGGWPR